jgi:hypothetical protein
MIFLSENFYITVALYVLSNNVTVIVSLVSLIMNFDSMDYMIKSLANEANSIQLNTFLLFMNLFQDFLHLLMLMRTWNKNVECVSGCNREMCWIIQYKNFNEKYQKYFSRLLLTQCP